MDEGFDVWIVNGCGMRWSYGYKMYVKYDKEYWDWIWDEFVEYDLLVMFKFVIMVIGLKVFYVGYS